MQLWAAGSEGIMYFYEFDKGFDYYALISAESEEKAMALYNEEVDEIECEISEDAITAESFPKKLTKEEAKEEYEKAQGAGTESFEEIIKESPCLLLIDGSLV